MNQSTIRASAFLVIAIALIAGGYLYQNSRIAPVANSNTSTTTVAQNAATSSQVAISKEAMTIVQPKTDAKITFGKDIPADAKALISKKLDEFRALIAADKYDFNAWVNLGTTYKIGGDYKNALAIWDYVSKAWPTNVVSFANTADLYMNFLKDYPKAEKAYLTAIQNNATDSNLYRNLFTLYSDTSYKPSNTAAEDILKKYITGNPKAYDMQVLLARYYAKTGRTDEAKTTFTAAAQNAAAQGNAEAAASIRTEAGIK